MKYIDTPKKKRAREGVVALFCPLYGLLLFAFYQRLPISVRESLWQVVRWRWFSDSSPRSPA